MKMMKPGPARLQAGPHPGFGEPLRRFGRKGWGLITSFLTSYALWAGLAFTIFLFVFEYNRFVINFRELFELIYDETLQLETAFSKLALHLLLALLVTLCFFGASFKSKPGWRGLYFVLFSLIVIIEYGYQKANQNFMASYDLQTALDSPQNWAAAIPAYFNWLVGLPIGLYGLLLWTGRGSAGYGLKQFGLLLLFLFGLNLGLYLHTGRNPLEAKLRTYAAGPTFSLPAFFRTMTMAGLEHLLAYHGNRETLDFTAPTRPQNNLVFIVDESIRADHLSLNGYARPTTPYLEQLAGQGRLYNWGIAAAGSTCSYRSVALLLTGVTELPDTGYQLKRQPTIFQYAKAMQYRTYYLEGEGRSPRFGLSDDDFAFVDVWLTQGHFGDDYDTDRRLAAEVAGLLRASQGNFVLIFKRGAHFPYNGNYPADQARWQPVLAGNQIVSNDVTALVNSYDNGLAYNLDTFFETLLADDTILETTTIVYTADHGETLGEATYPHCGDSKNEAAVPLFMVAPAGLALDTGYRASHHNLFATLLDLMAFPAAEQPYAYSLSLLKSQAGDSQPRFFFHGSLFGVDEYRWVPFDP